ncbi:hypothetical protein E5163_08875 [Marinicauda algicola]|uniref:TonB C-terminal domain-containing protein n=1 Tax=Marinicauda algicola TaxID=2029849 RepID=A0A4S2H1R9_9PROT|nr:hypothetical protein [Marinicauda algicola]TGY89221.1 hypothetical protein E5163_08875 [Marinicauda algicola]
MKRFVTALAGTCVIAAAAPGAAADPVSCETAREDGLASAADFAPHALPAAIWRMAYHGDNDYRAAVEVRYRVDADGRVRDLEFLGFSGAPRSHHRHLRQASRRAVRDWRFDLDRVTNGRPVAACEDVIVYAYDHPHPR